MGANPGFSDNSGAYFEFFSGFVNFCCRFGNLFKKIRTDRLNFVSKRNKTFANSNLVKDIAGVQFRNNFSFSRCTYTRVNKTVYNIAFPDFFAFFREEKFKTEAERLRKDLESADEKQRSATEMKVGYCCAYSTND